MSTDVYNDQEDGFSVPLDATEIENPEQLESAGYISKEGKYHVQVEEVSFVERDTKVYGDDTVHYGRQVHLKVVVVGGEHADQEGKKATIKIPVEQRGEAQDGDEMSITYAPLEERDRNNMIRLLYSLRMCELGTKFTPQWSLARGCQCILEAKGNKEGKYIKFAPYLGAWRLEDPAVKDVPKDAQLAAYEGIDLGSAEANDDISDI